MSHTKREMLRGDCSKISIDEYKSEFKWLRLPEVSGITEYMDKQRYIYSYHIYRFVKSIVIGVSAIFSSYLFIIFIDRSMIINLYESNRFFRALWPWNTYQIIQFNSSAMIGAVGETAPEIQLSFLALCSIASGVGVVWIIFVMLNEVRLASRYVPPGPHLLTAVFIFLATSSLAWFGAASDLNINRSILEPSIFDSYQIYSIKKIFIIYSAYLLVGFLVFSASLAIRSKIYKNLREIGNG